MENFVQFFHQLNPFWVYVTLFGIAFIENIFPPAPSDLMIVAGGSLIGMGEIHFLPALLFASAGSTAGFLVMYKAGEWFGESIVEKDKWTFIPKKGIHTVESWFRKYGYWIIVANRFLSGTRAVVSVFAGLSELDLKKTSALCLVSSLLWNGILVSAGMLLGENWHLIGLYLATYSQFITAALAVIVVVSLFIWLYRRSKNS
ncbi:MAG: DedA family protein [Acidobacteriota bacterium]